MLTLVTGGARSGKSAFAHSLCDGAERVLYIATAHACDEEMQRRIQQHRESRPVSWTTVEEPLRVADVARDRASDFDVVLIDCITIWLSNLLFTWRDDDAPMVERSALGHAIQLTDAARKTNLIAVTNEVGSGIVPESLVARQFRDLQGFVNQQLARAAQSVYLVASGIPIRIKPSAEGYR